MKDLSVINIGIDAFLPALQNTGTDFTNLSWKPPAQGDIDYTDMLFELSTQYYDDCGNSLITKANEEAFSRIANGSPILRRVKKAHECIPDLTKSTILHAGPPIHWNDMCEPMRTAILGALQYEGLAASSAEAQALMDSGKVFYGPTQPHGLVAPMTGIVSYSMPLMVVENESYGNFSYSPFNEGIGQTLRFGAYTPNVLQRLKWFEDVLAPVLDTVLQKLGGINIKNIMVQALAMGDEMHQRNIAASLLFYRKICCELDSAANSREDAISIMEFLARGNDQFFLNIAMAASKCILDTACNIPYSTVITSMSRNGVSFGITISGLGDKWFTAPSPKVQAVYFPGYSDDDACHDMGDSSIVECFGLGGFATGASPAIAKLLGNAEYSKLSKLTSDLNSICVDKNRDLALPFFDFAGVPTGIDLCKVLANNILPIINSGVAHRFGGVGQVGAGVVSPPVEIMRKALKYFYDNIKSKHERSE